MPERNDAPEQPAGPHHIADEPVAKPGASDAGVKSPVTSTGLPVEEQIRKEWDPKKNGGLPVETADPPDDDAGPD